MRITSKPSRVVDIVRVLRADDLWVKVYLPERFAWIIEQIAAENEYTFTGFCWAPKHRARTRSKSAI
jgi:hypothetical protein